MPKEPQQPTKPGGAQEANRYQELKDQPVEPKLPDRETLQGPH